MARALPTLVWGVQVADCGIPSFSYSLGILAVTNHAGLRTKNVASSALQLVWGFDLHTRVSKGYIEFSERWEGTNYLLEDRSCSALPLSVHRSSLPCLRALLELRSLVSKLYHQ